MMVSMFGDSFCILGVECTSSMYFTYIRHHKEDYNNDTLNNNNYNNIT